MSDHCDRCALESCDCMCYVYELEERIETLEKNQCTVLQTVNILMDIIERMKNER